MPAPRLHHVRRAGLTVALASALFAAPAAVTTSAAGADAAPAPAPASAHVAGNGTAAPTGDLCAPRPSTYVFSTTPGENPEGIEVHRGTMYVTSVKTGLVMTGSVRDGSLRTFSPAGADDRTHATGVHVDPFGRVVVAGAMTGALWVYDAQGRLLQRLLAPGVASTAEETQFLNDFVFSGGYVYVTESWTGAVYRARVTAQGYGPLERWVDATAFPGELGFLNGIVATPGGRYLLVSDYGTNTTYRIDTRTRTVITVRVTDRAGRPSSFGADGLLLDGHVARGVMTDWDAEMSFVRTVAFSPDWSRAVVIGDSRKVGFDVTPTTIAWDRGRLLWVESQLNVDPSVPPYVVRPVPSAR